MHFNDVLVLAKHLIITDNCKLAKLFENSSVLLLSPLAAAVPCTLTTRHRPLRKILWKRLHWSYIACKHSVISFSPKAYYFCIHASRLLQWKRGFLCFIKRLHYASEKDNLLFDHLGLKNTKALKSVESFVSRRVCWQFLCRTGFNWTQLSYYEIVKDMERVS